MTGSDRGNPGRRIWRTNLFGLALAIAATGCAVYSPPVITARTDGPIEAGPVELISAEDDSGLRASFAAALRRSLSASATGAKEGPALVADYAIAARQSGTAVAGIPADQEIPVKSAARKKGWLDRCNATRLRASLAVFQKASGALVYRGEAETDFCKGKELAVDALAQLLVSDMQANR